MAEQTLKDLRNDFEEDALEDILNASAGKTSPARGKGPKPGLIVKVKQKLKVFSISKKVLMISLVAILLISGLTVGGVLFLKKKPEKVQEAHDQIEQKKEEVKIESHLPKGPEFNDIVTLKSFEHLLLKEDSDMKAIRLSLSLELFDSRDKQKVEAAQEKIGQIIEQKMKQMTWQDLRDVEGKIKLKYDLLKQINAIFPEIMIRNIFFTNFIMQR